MNTTMQPAPPAVPTTNTLAVVSLVFGVLAWTFMPVLGSIVAIITGHMARGEIRARAGVQSGDGLAIAGLVLGWIQLALIMLAVFAILVAILFFGGLAALLAAFA